jgi:2-amino-4-hydroxy-6-hydroxymethyldihydropteridine diphosphokinase
MAAASRQAFVGAGANLGDRAATLHGALERLRAWPGVRRLEASSVFETVPVGVTKQPMFLNLVAGIDTTLTPEELMEALRAIEREFGRVRREKWGPRTLDLDLLAYEGEVRATTELQLPHPRMLERGFVTVPLRELLQHPGFKQPAWAALREQLAGLPAAEAGVKPFTG